MPEVERKTAIEARGLRKACGATAAVDGLNLTVAAGEVFGLVGPDGAGKTTTMRMLAGALPPSGGWAGVAGFDAVSQADLFFLVFHFFHLFHFFYVFCFFHF